MGAARRAGKSNEPASDSLRERPVGRKNRLAMSLPDDRARVRNDLRAVIERVEVREASAGRVHLVGTSRFGTSLVGPPGRLHGGLHAYARIFPILAKVPGHDAATTFPCRIELDLYRPLPLDESVPFEATYSRDESGFVLDVRHADTVRLASRAHTATGVDPRLAWFRDAYARSHAEAPEREIKAQGDVPMRMHRELVVMPMDRTMRTTGSPTFAKFADEDGRVDLAAMCVALDLVGAVTQGYAWTSRIFTARIDLVLERDAVPGDVDLVLLADRRSEPDLDCPLRPVSIPGGEAGPTKVRVLLADASFERAYAHGTFTIVPAKPRPDA